MKFVAAAFILLVVALLAYKTLLPWLVNHAVSTVTSAAAAKSLTLDFSHAKTMELHQDIFDVPLLMLAISQNKGLLTIDESTEKYMVLGQVRYLGKKPNLSYHTRSGVGILHLASTDQAGEDRSLHLPMTTPLNLNLAAGVAKVKLDFTRLNVTGLNLALSVGEGMVTFSERISIQAALAAEAAPLTLNIPRQNGVKVILTKGITSNLPSNPNYIKVDDGYESKNYQEAEVKVDLTIDQAGRGITINSI